MQRSTFPQMYHCFFFLCVYIVCLWLSLRLARVMYHMPFFVPLRDTRASCGLLRRVMQRLSACSGLRLRVCVLVLCYENLDYRNAGRCSSVLFRVEVSKRRSVEHRATLDESAGGVNPQAPTTQGAVSLVSTIFDF